jgi:hypothetical protein
MKDRALESQADALLAQTPPSEAQLEQVIGAAIDAQRAWMLTTVELFIALAAAGRALAAQKAALKHGQWETWLRAHIPSRSPRNGRPYAAESWLRIAQKWMVIAKILDQSHPEAIEMPEIVLRLHHLADLIPERMNKKPAAIADLQPDELLKRVRNWCASPLLDAGRLRNLPPGQRADLRQIIEPIWLALL